MTGPYTRYFLLWVRLEGVLRIILRLFYDAMGLSLSGHGLYGMEESQVIKISARRVSRLCDEDTRPTIAIATSL